MKYTPFLLLFLLYSCKNEVSQNNQNSSSKKEEKQQIAFTIESPITNDTLQIGENIDFSLSITDTTKIFDSVNLFLNSKLIYSSPFLNFSLPLAQSNVGRGVLGIEMIYSDSDKQRKNIELFFLSDIIPESIDFTLTNKYTHSTDNFTEGLVFDDGLIYEGTGDWGQSAIYATDLETGKFIKGTVLSSNIFGEGITILNNKIVQLTYKSQEGYVYDKDKFSLIRKFSYQFSQEGWGLTTDGENLIMSNGTDKLYTMDSTYYSLIKERQVCDNKEPLDSINELEYVDGIIYANIWMDNRIAKIDYESGKVLGYIDLSSLVPRKYKNHHANVLNGIAYNSANGNLFVTGKKWDSIFEIMLKE